MSSASSRTRGRRRGADGWVGEGDHEREGKDCTSREMFVIGGAGTDPIRVRELHLRGEVARYVV